MVNIYSNEHISYANATKFINENQGLSENNYYYTELKSEWPKIVDIQPPEKEGNRLIGSTDSRTDDDNEADGIVLELKDSLDLTQATFYLDILNQADMQIDAHGNDVGYEARLEDIKSRYKESDVYNKCLCLVNKIRDK